MQTSKRSGEGMAPLLLDTNLVVQIDKSEFQTQNPPSPSGTSPASSCPILSISDDEERKAAVNPESVPPTVSAGTHTQETFQVYLRWRRALKQAARLGKGLAGRDKQYRRFRSTEFPRSLSDVCCSPSSAGVSLRASLGNSPLSNYLALPQGCQALLLRTEHWLEVADPRHRYGSNLRPYLDYWLAINPSKPDSCKSERTSPRNPINSVSRFSQVEAGTDCLQQQKRGSACGEGRRIDINIDNEYNAGSMATGPVQQSYGMHNTPGIITEILPAALHISTTTDRLSCHRSQQSCIALQSSHRPCNSFTQFETKPTPSINLDQSCDNFFRWLDHGEGRHIDLGPTGGPPRLKLETEIVEYLTEDQLAKYEVAVEPTTGQLLYCLSGRPVDTRWQPRLPNQANSETTCTGPPPWELVQHNDLEQIQGCDTQFIVETDEPAQGARKAEGSSAKACKWIYVVDTDGCFYVHPKVRGRFHHSSFLRGGAVLAAGAMVVHGGRLKAMTADSGHYWPQPDHFKWFYQLLKAQGADLSALTGMTFRTKH